MTSQTLPKTCIVFHFERTLTHRSINNYISYYDTFKKDELKTSPQYKDIHDANLHKSFKNYLEKENVKLPDDQKKKIIGIIMGSDFGNIQKLFDKLSEKKIPMYIMTENIQSERVLKILDLLGWRKYFISIMDFLGTRILFEDDKSTITKNIFKYEHHDLTHTYFRDLLNEFDKIIHLDANQQTHDKLIKHISDLKSTLKHETTCDNYDIYTIKTKEQKVVQYFFIKTLPKWTNGGITQKEITSIYEILNLPNTSCPAQQPPPFIGGSNNLYHQKYLKYKSKYMLLKHN